MYAVCTPLGFVRLFDVVGKYLIKPQFLRDINEEYFACALEEESLRRRLKHAQATGNSYVSPIPMSLDYYGPAAAVTRADEYILPNSLLRLRNGELQSGLSVRLTEMETKRKLLDKQRKTSSLRRNLVYPVAMILLIGLTGITVLIVVHNTIELLIGIRALPLSSRVSCIIIVVIALLFCLKNNYFNFYLIYPLLYECPLISIHVGYKLVIDAGSARSCSRDNPDPVFNRHVFYWIIFVAAHVQDKTEGALHPVQLDNRQLYSGVDSEFRATFASEDFRHYEFRFARRFRQYRMAGQFQNCSPVQFGVRRRGHPMFSQQVHGESQAGTVRPVSGELLVSK
ncbi:lipocalin-1 interacting membrane receptor limr [Holotrichia oblita]|uniref:Lipocalin-1 interacting membrane receptor limr n=1 Tax=Holotrichia oblita TaxID=644536 RepID=A0ACB9T0Q8_HOLOL|nr:lipocalin-1 interacting membrane receptor limr [Holotrichia oblita]